MGHDTKQKQLEMQASYQEKYTMKKLRVALL